MSDGGSGGISISPREIAKRCSMAIVGFSICLFVIGIVLGYRVVDLEDTLSLGKSKVLRSNWVLNVDGAEVITISVQYAGYVRIEFTSSCGVYFIASNRVYGYEIRYPRDGIISRGSFTIPVLPGDQYLTIFSPSCRSTIVVMNITYVY